MRYRITAPVKGATCTVAGVAIADGVGHTSDEGAVSYFRRHGYEVEECPEPVEEHASATETPTEEPAPAPAPMPDRWASTADWREWASTDGGMTADQVSALDREQIAAHFMPEPAPAPTTGRSQRKRTTSKETAA